MKKTLAKILALALCAVLLVTATVFITLAYLQDSTTVVRNTFTYGKVAITLTESLVDKDGNPAKMVDGKLVPVGEGEEAPRIPNATDETLKDFIGNEYKVVPGRTYTKDPVVRVDDNSEDCFIFVAIRDPLFDKAPETTLEGKTIEEQMVEHGWCKFESMGIYDASDPIDPRNDYIPDDLKAFAQSYDYTVYYYNDIAKAGVSYPVFDTITFGTTTSSEPLVDTDVIEIVAFAVQTEGFEKVLVDGTESTEISHRAYRAFMDTYGGDPVGG